MSAIITDQLRILNAKKFVQSVDSEENSYYAFVGVTNPSDYDSNWDFSPPAPKDNFDQENDYWDTMIGMKKIYPSDVRQVVRKITWQSGTTYDMYRHDISRTKLSVPSNSTNLYSSNFYVVNSDYRVYLCLYNGIDPDNPRGKPSLDEPTFTDLEPRSAGNSEDGYIWKYLYTIKPSELVKFDSTNFIPVPSNWEMGEDYSVVRNYAKASGQLKIITVTNRGSGIGTANRTYTNVPIKGDGTGGKCTVVIDADSKVDYAVVTDGGSGYTFATVDLLSGGVPKGTTSPVLDVIIPPQNGHGYDIYKELGSYRVLLYSRIENDIENPDFVVGNKISRIGIVENPLEFDGESILTNKDKVSCLSALKLVGTSYSTSTFIPNSIVSQTIGVGITAYGRVVSYDKNTGILKYWQDRTLFGFSYDGLRSGDSNYGINMNKFNSSVQTGGSLTINSSGISGLSIDSSFTGISTTINNRNYYFGQYFINGVSNPEVQKYSGNIIYVDNRPSITRSLNQKEDIKVILQF